MNLKALDPQSAFIVKVLQRQSDFNAAADASTDHDRLSIIYTAASEKAAGQFLNLVENPRVQGQEIFLDVPRAFNNIIPYATYLVLSELKEITVNGRAAHG